jgi:hypothetical protein
MRAVERYKEAALKRWEEYKVREERMRKVIELTKRKGKKQNKQINLKNLTRAAASFVGVVSLGALTYFQGYRVTDFVHENSQRVVVGAGYGEFNTEPRYVLPMSDNPVEVIDQIVRDVREAQAGNEEVIDTGIETLPDEAEIRDAIRVYAKILPIQELEPLLYAYVHSGKLGGYRATDGSPDNKTVHMLSYSHVGTIKEKAPDPGVVERIKLLQGIIHIPSVIADRMPVHILTQVGAQILYEDNVTGVISQDGTDSNQVARREVGAPRG